MSQEPNEELSRHVSDLKDQLNKALHKIRELEVEKNLPAETARVAVEAVIEITPINEADVTLRRLVQRIAMILQCEKVVIMFHDRELGELIGIPPAYGVDESRLVHFRIRATHGISGEVFRTGIPANYRDILNDPRTKEDPFSLVHAKNGVTVPLVIEKRDDENRVIDRTVIGILHAFNKLHGEDFNDEDLRLLERMAKNVGSIISNLQLFRNLEKKQEELSQTLEALTAGLVLVSPEGRIIQMNSSARAIFNVVGEPQGKFISETVQNEGLQSLLRNATMGSDTGKAEIHTVIAGSERTYEGQAAAVRSDDNKSLGVVVILSDVTEIRNIDRMKSNFVAMASHELRTPLTAIKGFSSTLLEGVDTGMYSAEDQKEFLGIVVSECDRLRRLIDDLLNTSRIEAGESLTPNYTEFPLRSLLNKVVMIQRQATSKHTIELDIQTELPASIVGDEDKLDQILTNLLNNAIKYSPNGGAITVHASHTGHLLRIGVRDQGLGIPKEHTSKVFERFHRVNNEDNRKIYGTGLGLFLVKHLVETVHMGKIWCESEVGVGSDFIFEFPSNIDIEEAKRATD